MTGGPVPTCVGDHDIEPAMRIHDMLHDFPNLLGIHGIAPEAMDV
jgi:hypothetical protein